jgi:LytS/YehU family sensor histidine kinase
MSEARLQVLQSQIEPHFLFNSLAHVRRLCRTNAPAGRAMLRHLAHYIGAAQPALQHAGIELAADAALAVDFLNIQQIRMGERLRFSVDVAPEARGARVPPMTLTTLVENAIKHGLSPLADGGEVGIAARVQGDTIVVEVADSGRGFQSTVGAGVGLANIRARLAILHGARASLALSMNAPQGVVATVVLPRERAGASSA